MASIKFIKSNEKRKILKELENQYGITELPYLLIQGGKSRLRAFSGHLSKEEMYLLSDLTNVEVIGAYAISRRDNDLRLSFDIITLLKDQITKNIVEISDKQLDEWLHGQDLEIPNIPRGLVTIKHNNDFVGAGKSNTEKIFNYVPKERKLRTPLSK